MSLTLLLLIQHIHAINVIPIDDANLGWQYDGIGGLDAVGCSRLLFEYPQQIRSQILDLIFKPNYGPSYQILKSEINGDDDSSYGSGSSFMHTRDDNDPIATRFNRGTRSWFMQEALKRNPNLTLYALSWGVPYWVGNQSFYSQQGIDYHIQWLLGVKKIYNVTYDYIGVWNEMPYEVPTSSYYVLGLRDALDKNGLSTVQISVPDGNGKYVNTVINEAYTNSIVGNAISVIGQHDSAPFNFTPPAHLSDLRLKYGIKYWNSENNIEDAQYPQYPQGIEYIRAQIQNYLCCNSTATIMCPFTHSWSFNYGRQNHGQSRFIEPWSGYYKLMAGFWMQSHYTQFTRNDGKWHYLNYPSTNKLFCSDPDPDTCQVFHAVLTSQDYQDFSVIITNEDVTNGYTFILTITNAFYDNLIQNNVTSLVHWRTLNGGESEWFTQQKNIELFIDNTTDMITCNVDVEAMSIHTISTLTSANKVTYPVPKRFQFPTPHRSDFDTQTLGNPGFRLSDNFGAFDVAIDPLNGNNKVLKQAAPQNPYRNAWGHKLQPYPFTAFPSGTNWMNYNISANVLSMDENNTISVCGKIPLWDPNQWTHNYTLGICLYLEYGPNRKWFISMNSHNMTSLIGVVHEVTEHPNRIGVVRNWNYVSLGFSDGVLQAVIGHNRHEIVYVSKPYKVQEYTEENNGNTVLYLTGVAGVGTHNWGIMYYDNVTLEVNKDHMPTPNGSYIMDALVDSRIVNNVRGYVGCVFSMANAETNIKINRLGRFKVAGYNNQTHEMNIIKVLGHDRYEFMIGEFSEIKNKINLNSCITDLNGFCYTEAFGEGEAIELEVNNTYFMVSKEEMGGDYFMNVSDSATTSTHSHRSGTTYISYLGPKIGSITGRVIFENERNVNVIQQLDTCFGPINWVLL